MVQWLRLHTSKAGGTSLNPHQETKIPNAVQHSQKQNNNRLPLFLKCPINTIIKWNNKLLGLRKQFTAWGRKGYQIHPRRHANFITRRVSPASIPPTSSFWHTHRSHEWGWKTNTHVWLAISQSLLCQCHAFSLPSQLRSSHVLAHYRVTDACFWI